MKTRALFTALILGACVAASAPAGPLGSAFTYQGRLDHNGQPANGHYDFWFFLVTEPIGGYQVGNDLTNSSVAVSNGLFTTQLDFGPEAFPGDARWLGIGVRASGTTNDFYVLWPRQALTATPHALYAANAATASGVETNAVTGAGIQNGSITADKVAAGQVVKSLNGLTDMVLLKAGANVALTTSGNGLEISAAPAATSAWSLSGNSGINSTNQFLGTMDNEPVEVRVANQRALRIEPAFTPNWIAGHAANSVQPGLWGVTIGGGGVAAQPNLVTDFAHFATIGGGSGNQASGSSGVIGGGELNLAQGQYSTVGGGYSNRTTINALSATISGGENNQATNMLATVGGGSGNIAGSPSATIGGGAGNIVKPFSPWATIAGGLRNLANYSYSVVGGGSYNSALSVGATVAGGHTNVALQHYCTVGGGSSNWAVGVRSTISGGSGNFAGADSATIAGGGFNIAEGTNSTVAGGLANRARAAEATVAGGYTNRAWGVRSTVSGGAFNLAGSDYATVGGGAGNASAYLAATVGGGLTNQALADHATVGGGHDNMANGASSTVSGGQGNSATGESATVGGGDGNGVSGDSATVAGGEANVAMANRSTVSGGFLNIIRSDSPSATIGGGMANNIFTNSSSATIGGGNSNSIFTNSFHGTISGGALNAIYAGASTIGGGQDNSVTNFAFYSTIPGGYRALARTYGQMAYASGRFAANGDAQTSLFVVRRVTTNAVPADLYPAGANIARVIVPEGSTWAFDILVSARSELGDSAGYQIKGVIENEGLQTKLVGVPTVTPLGAEAGAAGWSVAVQADNGTDSLVVKATGADATTIRWVATVRTTEVMY